MKESFLWGSLGGGLIVLYAIAIHARNLRPDWKPAFNFRNAILCVLGLAFPVVSGLLTMAMTDPLRYVLEGVSIPTLVLFVVKESPLFPKKRR